MSRGHATEEEAHRKRNEIESLSFLLLGADKAESERTLSASRKLCLETV